jgi:hypothetical protein
VQGISCEHMLPSFHQSVCLSVCLSFRPALLRMFYAHGFSSDLGMREIFFHHTFLS